MPKEYNARTASLNRSCCQSHHQGESHYSGNKPSGKYRARGGRDLRISSELRDGWVTQKDVSDNLIFRQAKNEQGMVVSVFVNLCSDDNGDFLAVIWRIPVRWANVGDRPAISEGVFGGFSYTPTTSSDPGFQPGAATQNLFVEDVSDVPEPVTFNLVGYWCWFSALSVATPDNDYH